MPAVFCSSAVFFFSNFSIIPTEFFLEGMAHEAKGDLNSARENYENLLFLWAGADEGIPELEDTRKRLAKIMRVQG